MEEVEGSGNELPDGTWEIVGTIHDELQVHGDEEFAETIGRILVEEAERAGEPYGFKLPLTAKYTIGDNWAETH